MKHRGEDAKSFFNPNLKETDGDGMAVFKNMPQGTHDFFVYKEGWEAIEDPETGEKGKTRVTIGSEDQKLTIKMYPQKIAESEFEKGDANESDK